jgi:hypothetical protein
MFSCVVISWNRPETVVMIHKYGSADNEIAAIAAMVTRRSHNVTAAIDAVPLLTLLTPSFSTSHSPTL